MESFKIISPVDDQIFEERPYTSDTEIEKVLEKGAKAFNVWRQFTVEQRAGFCHKVIQYFKSKSDQWGEEITWQMGRPISYSAFEISKGFVERAEYMVGIAEAALSGHHASQKAGYQRYVKREPLGVVLVLAPWNYPYLTAVNAVIPAIMAGNTVVLKHAEQTALCAERFAEAFRASGIPEDVFQFVHCTHTQAGKMIEDQRIAHVSFTGSVEGGRAIQGKVGTRFIGSGLELGGKDPAYVTKDADIVHAINNLVDGAFFNSGQSCCGVERIYVQEKLFDDFIEGFVAEVKKYQLGNPTLKETTLGPVVRRSNAERITKQVDAAIQMGAVPLIKPGDFPDFPLPYLAPQVLINVDHSMEVMQEETFGPVVGIMSVKDDEEAIRLMNDSKYGLTASIWTPEIERAISIGDRVETGTWFMNRCDYLDPELAWTGVKQSGKGCTLSSIGYETLTRPKSYHLKL